MIKENSDIIKTLPSEQELLERIDTQLQAVERDRGGKEFFWLASLSELARAIDLYLLKIDYMREKKV